MEMCGLSLYLRQIVEYEAGSPPHPQWASWRNFSPPPRNKTDHTSFGSQASHYIEWATLNELLRPPNKKLSGNFKENQFTQSTRTETNITFTPPVYSQWSCNSKSRNTCREPPKTYKVLTYPTPPVRIRQCSWSPPSEPPTWLVSSWTGVWNGRTL